MQYVRHVPFISSLHPKDIVFKNNQILLIKEAIVPWL